MRREQLCLQQDASSETWQSGLQQRIAPCMSSLNHCRNHDMIGDLVLFLELLLCSSGELSCQVGERDSQEKESKRRRMQTH